MVCYLSYHPWRPIHPLWYVTWVTIHGDPSTRHGMLCELPSMETHPPIMVCYVCELLSMETHPPVMVRYMCVSCHPWRPIHPSWYVTCVWVTIHGDPSTRHGMLLELPSMETHPPVMACYVCVCELPSMETHPPTMVCYVSYHPWRPIHPSWYVTWVTIHGDPSTRHGMLRELPSMETHPPVMVCYVCVSCHPWRPIHPSWYVTCVWVTIHGDPSTHHGMLRVCELSTMETHPPVMVRYVCELSSMETHPPVMVCYVCVSCQPWRPIHPSWYVTCVWVVNHGDPSTRHGMLHVWVTIHGDPSTRHGMLRVCELSSMETHPPVMVCYVCVSCQPWRPIHPSWYVTCVSYHPWRPIHPSWYVTCVSYHPWRPIHPSWYVTCASNKCVTWKMLSCIKPWCMFVSICFVLL